MTTTTAYLSDGRHVDVPAEDVRDWRYLVSNEDTTLGLADWYTDQGDKHLDKIQGPAIDDTRCDHHEFTHRVMNESQSGDKIDPDGPLMMASVCHRRACILDAMAWVERGTGENAVWAGPDQEYSSDAPTDPLHHPEAPDGHGGAQAAPNTTLTPERLQRLRDGLSWHPDPFDPKPWTPHPEGEAPAGWLADGEVPGHCVASECSRDDLAALLDELDRFRGHAVSVNAGPENSVVAGAAPERPAQR